MDKKKLAEMIALVEKLLGTRGVEPHEKTAYQAQIAIFRKRIESMSLLDLFARANKVGMAELATVRAMADSLIKNPLCPAEKQAAFVHKAAHVMKVFLA